MTPHDPPPAELTLGQHLDEWLDLQRTQVQRSTWASYRATIRRYIEPHLGEVPLHELTVAELNAHYEQLLARGGGRGGRPLGVRSVEYAHAILHKALEDAVAMDLLEANPSDRARRPKRHGTTTDEQEPVAWTATHLRIFLAAVRDHELRELFVVAAYTGLRRGELLGLAWDDLDLDAPSLRVRHSLSVVRGRARLKAPKTGKQRTLHLDDVTVGALRRQRARQHANRQAAGAAWDNPWDLVFTDARGRYHSPDSVSNRFRRAVERAPVPRVRLHDLRHLHATLMLEAGVPVKVVSERLGHATTQLTLDVYAHVLPAMDAEAVERFAALVLGDDAARLIATA